MRYAAVGLIGLAAAAAVVGFVTHDPSAVGWTVTGVCLVALSVLISVPRAAVGSLLIALIFVAAGVLVVAAAIVPLPDVKPMPKAYAIFGSAVAIAARAMVREGLGGLPATMLGVGAAFLVAGVILLPDRTLGLAPLSCVVGGAAFAGLGAFMLHASGTWRRLWAGWRDLFHRSQDS